MIITLFLIHKKKYSKHVLKNISIKLLSCLNKLVHKENLRNLPL